VRTQSFGISRGGANQGGRSCIGRVASLLRVTRKGGDFKFAYGQYGNGRSVLLKKKKKRKIIWSGKLVGTVEREK